MRGFLTSVYLRVVDKFSHRGRLARAYLRGKGIEIGALHRPLPLPYSATARFVDRLTREGLKSEYPELRHMPLVRVDCVDDGESLTTFSEGSLDFIIANHFLEHSQDPIGTLKRHWAVLRPGGTLYYTVPDKRYTFDRLRPLTSLEHLYRDHADGPILSYDDHVREYVALVENTGQVAPSLCRGYEMIVKTGFSIHYHVWTPTSFLDLILDLRRRGEFAVEVAAVETSPKWSEFVCVLQKTSAP